MQDIQQKQGYPFQSFTSFEHFQFPSLYQGCNKWETHYAEEATPQNLFAHVCKLPSMWCKSLLNV